MICFAYKIIVDITVMIAMFSLLVVMMAMIFRASKNT